MNFMQAFGIARGGPRDCTVGASDPVRGGPYGGLAYSIIGTGTVYTESGRFKEVGRLEHTLMFVALGQQLQLQATQDLPW